jgi:DNA-binding MarR family transcriptional regulator
MTTTRQPIGYWLKRLDSLIERRFTAVLGDAGVSRRRWQILNTIRTAGPAPRTEVHAALSDFGTARELDDLVDGLVERGWVDEARESDDPAPSEAEAEARVLGLTDAGARAHDRIRTEVERFRSQAMRGIDGHDYDRVIDTLRRMVANLEADAPDGPARRNQAVSCESGVRISEPGASQARTQEEGAARGCGDDEDAVSGVPGRRGVRHDSQDTA